MMFLILTPNPAVDRTMLVTGLRPGAVLRAERTLVAAGGKGLNVARVARVLELPALVCAPLGGFAGRMLAELAAAEGLAGDWVQQDSGETRTCVLVVDPQNGDATALNENGPTLSHGDWQRFADRALDLVAAADLVAVCGSLPPGVPPAALAELLQAIAAGGRRLIVDTSGPALRAALDAGPYAVKVNAAELATALDRPIAGDADAVAALAELHRRGIELAAVTLGADGALASDGATCYHARPPAVEVLSSIGSGDAMLAGLAAGLRQNLDLPQTLQLAVACGSANARQFGGGRVDPTDLKSLRQAVVLTKVIV